MFGVSQYRWASYAVIRLSQRQFLGDVVRQNRAARGGSSRAVKQRDIDIDINGEQNSLGRRTRRLVVG